MAETKSEAFHRLATKRVETILDAIRIFSNLSGPSYEWTPEEVDTYFGQIENGLAEAMARFQDTKRWKQSGYSGRPMTSLFESLTPEQKEAVLTYDGPEDHGDPEGPKEEPAPPAKRSRQMAIGDIIREANNDRETLAEVIALQREVIERQQVQLDELRRS